jgi:hypothetical protein
MSNDNSLSSLYKKVGGKSKALGILFTTLSVSLLVLSLIRENIVFEVDSVVCFLAAIFLLFKDPRNRVQARVLDAIMLTSNEALAELSAVAELSAGVSFDYVATGGKVSDVSVLRSRTYKTALPNGGIRAPHSLKLTPPGRGLAELFVRETGLKDVSIEALKVTLPSMMRENFGLAESVNFDIKDYEAEVVLHQPSSVCKCEDEPHVTGGYLGCTVASSLAVLVCFATKRSVKLRRCIRDPATDAWKISMALGPWTIRES